MPPSHLGPPLMEYRGRQLWAYAIALLVFSGCAATFHHLATMLEHSGANDDRMLALFLAFGCDAVLAVLGWATFEQARRCVHVYREGLWVRDGLREAVILFDDIVAIRRQEAARRDGRMGTISLEITTSDRQSIRIRHELDRAEALFSSIEATLRKRASDQLAASIANRS